MYSGMTGNDFKSARQALGWTKAETARRFGVSAKTIWEWETKAPTGTASALMNILRKHAL